LGRRERLVSNLFVTRNARVGSGLNGNVLIVIATYTPRWAKFVGPVLLAMCSVGFAAPIEGWTIRHPLPSNANLFNAAHGRDTYVIVGAGGALITSRNLEEWTTNFRPELMENVIFAGDQFVITGYRGEILTSPDGENWTVRSSGTELSLTGIAYGDGRYVAAGEDGVSATSTDGVDWTVSDTGDDLWYFGVAYGAGRFVAVSFDLDQFTLTGGIATTVNGIDWQLVTLPEGLPSFIQFYDVGHGDGRFIATGYFYDESTNNSGVIILTSTDGLTWLRVDHPNIPDATNPDNNQWWLDVIRHDGTQWVGAGDNGLVMTSVDGLNWAVAPFPGGVTSDFFGLAFGSGETLVVGTRGVAYASTDLSMWEARNTGNYGGYREIAFNGSQYLASGTLLMVSDDGRNWESQLPQINGTFGSAAYGNGRWVLASDFNTGQQPLTTSANGFDWTPPSVPEGFTDCRGVAFNNGMFVALPVSGPNSLAYSMDALDWTGVSHDWFTEMQDLVWIESGDGKFLAWSAPSPTVEVAISSDGTDWQVRDTGTTRLLYSAAYGDGRWLLVGDDGWVITTTDLVDWSEQQIRFGSNDPVRLEGVAHGAGQWVIVGRDHTIWSSTDGLVWEDAFTTQLDGSSFLFWEVTFDGSAFWVSGQDGIILQSESLSGVTPPSFAILPGSNPLEVRLEIQGTAGQSWDLLHSPVLPATAWERLTTITLQSGTGIHIESIPAGTSEGYFQLREP
jgi:hypothetical protein